MHLGADVQCAGCATNVPSAELRHSLTFLLQGPVKLPSSKIEYFPKLNVILFHNTRVRIYGILLHIGTEIKTI